jgi:hypothetical protein
VKRPFLSMFFMIVFVFAICDFVQGGIFTSVDVQPVGTGGVLAGGPGTGTVVIYKDFNPLVGLGPIDVDVSCSAGGNYWFYEAPGPAYAPGNGFIHNYSGYDWTDFHFQLISQTPERFRFYSLEQAGSYDVFSQDVCTATTIDLYGGMVPVGTDFHASFMIQAEAGGSFTIREFATIPEPSSIILLGMAAFSLIACVWRRRK